MPEVKRTKCPKCIAKVDALIANERTHFEEQDKVWLSALEEAQLDKLEPQEAPAAVIEAAPAETVPVVEEKPEEDDASEVQMNKETARQVLTATMKDPKQFMELLSPELRGQMEFGQQLYTEHRSGLIMRITSSTEEYSRKELEGKPTAELRKLANVCKPIVDYSPRGGGHSDGGETEALYPPGVGADKKED